MTPARGDVDGVRARIERFEQAGADHVRVQVLTSDPERLPLPEWRELAGGVPR